MLMGQQANTWPNFTRSKSRAGRPRLPFSASMMTLVSRRKVAISAAGYFFEALGGFLAQLFDPLGRSLLEFGMVLVLPGAGRGFRGFDLAEAHQFLFRRLGQKSAATALADEGVDLGNQLLGDDDVGTFDVHRPTYSLTACGPWQRLHRLLKVGFTSASMASRLRQKSASRSSRKALAPSESAFSGQSCTSTNTPSMPTATAARARGAMNSGWPLDAAPAPPGSCTLCVASKTTGQPASRIVLRPRMSTTRLL